MSGWWDEPSGGLVGNSSDSSGATCYILLSSNVMDSYLAMYLLKSSESLSYHAVIFHLVTLSERYVEHASR